MKKKDLIWWFGIFIFAIGLILIARSGNTPSSFVVSALEIVEESNWSFGEISMANGNVSHKFILKNSGIETVQIIKVQTSCMCTEAFLKISDNAKKIGPFGMHTSGGADISIAPGETVEIEAIYDPNAHGPSGTGFIERVIFIETNSSEKPKLQLKFTANVVE